MFPLRFLPLIIVLAVSHAPLQCSAWSLADRLTGRVFPFQYTPRRRHQHQQQQRTKTTRHQASSSGSASSTKSSSSSTKRDNEQMHRFMEEPMATLVGDVEAGGTKTVDATLDPETEDFLRVIVQAADGRKAEDIVALKVNHVTTLTSALVILSGNSRPQNQAIAAAIQQDVQEAYGDHVRPGGSGVPEGSAESGWMLLDYGSIMVHIMTPKSRLYYNVEGQWRDKGGEPLDLSGILVPNKLDTEQDESDSDSTEEDDPFWS